MKNSYDFDKKNDNEVDFDEQKQKQAAKGMTFAKFVEECSESMKSISTWHLKHLEKFLVQKLSRKYLTMMLLGAFTRKNGAEEFSGKLATLLASPTGFEPKSLKKASDGKR